MGSHTLPVPVRYWEFMSPTGEDIHEALADAMSSTIYGRQDVDTGITAVITAEEDMRFLRSTLRSVLTGMPGGQRRRRDRAHQFEDNHRSRSSPPSGPVMEVQSKHVTIHRRPRATLLLGDAVSRALIVPI